jgi:hypothetical protein
MPDESPSPRRYPGPYEKLVPIALIVILVAAILIVLLALAVGLRLVPGV